MAVLHDRDAGHRLAVEPADQEGAGVGGVEGVGVGLARVPAFVGGPAGHALHVVDAGDGDLESSCGEASPLANLIAIAVRLAATRRRYGGSDETADRAVDDAVRALLSAGEANAEWAASLDRLGARSSPRRQSDGATGAKFAFPAPEQGRGDQTFRLVVKPDAWGPPDARSSCRTPSAPSR